MKVGVLVTGDTAVRAAHSLSALDQIDEVVVIGPARSKSFRVVKNADDCDVLIGTGPKAPSLARKHGVPLVWDGGEAEGGVVVWGADPGGLTLCLAASESDYQLVGVAHPEIASDGSTRRVRFPTPVGLTMVRDTSIDGRQIAVGRSKNAFAASYVVTTDRKRTILDDGKFMAGAALAAGVGVVSEETRPVWADPDTYIDWVTRMGLVIGEA